MIQLANLQSSSAVENFHTVPSLHDDLESRSQERKLSLGKARPSNWLHDRESFFKYTTRSTAHAILDSGSLRWSSPSSFNDPFDMQFDLYVDLDQERVTRLTIDALWTAFYSAEGIEAGNPLGELIKKYKSIFPKMSREAFEAAFGKVIREMCRRVPAHVSELNLVFQTAMKDAKVLCLSERCDSVLMWSHYAHLHEGVVFELACVPELDSAWGSAMRVTYSDVMPPAFDDESLIRLGSGQGHSSPKTLLDKFVTAKARDWAYEREWRVVLHFTDPGRRTQDIPFSPKELAAVYLGCRMPDDDKAEIAAKTRFNYPDAKIFAAEKLERQFALRFRDY
jgi:hypothetical protein